MLDGRRAFRWPASSLPSGPPPPSGSPSGSCRPAVLELHVRWLRTAQLSSRSLDVGSVQLGAAGDLARMADSPPMPFEGLTILHVPLREIERQLEHLRRAAWEL